MGLACDFRETIHPLRGYYNDMKATIKRPVLNPAFKRAQKLPALPAASLSRDLCAVPPAVLPPSRLQLNFAADLTSQRENQSAQHLRSSNEPGPTVEGSAVNSFPSRLTTQLPSELLRGMVSV
jgi:hypothetical protein